MLDATRRLWPLPLEFFRGMHASANGRRSRPLLILALLGASLSATQLGRAQPALPRYEPGACQFEGAASLEGKVECGSLVVAEDPARPDGAAVQVSVAVLKASGASRKPDPIVYLAGGPGGRGIAEVESWLARPFARGRDIVLVDQRGTGSSGPLCPESAKEVLGLMAEDQSPADDLRGNVDVARRCLADLRRRKIDPIAYGSAATAADLDALRAQLGYVQWNLLGISYGTRLAFTAMRDQPAGIRSVVLDSPFPPAADFYHNLSHSFAPALERLGADCASAPSCAQPVGDLAAELAAFEAELERRPLPLHIDAPEYLPGGTFVVNPQDLRFLVGEQLVFASSRSALPAFVHAWRMGETGSLAELVRVMAQMLGGHDLGKYYAVQCYEEMPFSAERLGSPRSGPPTAFHDAAPAVCADWQLPSADARENEPVRSSLPALLLAGELDPRAPPSFARQAVSHLERGVLIEVAGAGHGTLGEGCAAEVVAAFLDDPSRPPDSSCLAQRPAPTPLGALHLTSGPLRLLRSMRRGELVAPLWLGSALVILLSAVVLWPLRGLWRWRRNKQAAAMPKDSAASRRLQALALGSLALGALLAWVLVGALVRACLQLLSGANALAILAGLPGDVGALFVLPKVVLLATVSSLVAAGLAWRRGAWPRFERGHYLLTLAAASALVAFLVHYDLF